MVYERNDDLVARKKRLGWTNREVANAIGCQPGVASSKLNGFIVLQPSEIKKLSDAFEVAERAAGIIVENDNSVQQLKVSTVRPCNECKAQSPSMEDCFKCFFIQVTNRTAATI